MLSKEKQIKNNPITTWIRNFGYGTTFIGQNQPIQTYTTGVYFYNFVGTLKGGKVEIKKEGFFSLLGSK